MRVSTVDFLAANSAIVYHSVCTIGSWKEFYKKYFPSTIDMTEGTDTKPKLDHPAFIE